jgi:endonuclease-3
MASAARYDREYWASVIPTLRHIVRGGQLPSVSEIARESPDPFRVLVSTIISLRTKDEVTFAASRRLFESADTPAKMLELPRQRIEELIYPAGFYRNKAATIHNVSRIILEEHNGQVPPDVEKLTALPGVGRKTANLVLNLGFGIPAICVDTHVHRISNRFGWVETKNPDQTEMALGQILPRKHWIEINELLVGYGQQICTPVSPRCSQCPFSNGAPRCKRVGVTTSR